MSLEEGSASAVRFLVIIKSALKMRNEDEDSREEAAADDDEEEVSAGARDRERREMQGMKSMARSRVKSRLDAWEANACSKRSLLLFSPSRSSLGSARVETRHMCYTLHSLQSGLIRTRQ